MLVSSLAVIKNVTELVGDRAAGLLPVGLFKALGPPSAKRVGEQRSDGGFRLALLRKAPERGGALDEIADQNPARKAEKTAIGIEVWAQVEGNEVGREIAVAVLLA